MFSNPEPFGSVIDALAGSVCGYLGYDEDATRALTGRLREAIAGFNAQGSHQCSVRFRADGDVLTLVVSYAGGREWRTSLPLPS
jgi:hypothetical protein